MPREKDAYRDNLQRLDKMFPGRELLSKKDVCDYTGKGYRWVTNNIPFKNNCISKATLARFLS